jgi:spore germination protein GerM
MKKNEFFVVCVLLFTMLVLTGILTWVKIQGKRAVETRGLIYFLEYSEGEANVVPVVVTLPFGMNTEEKMEFLLRKMVSEKSASDDENKIFNAVPENVEILGVKLKGDIAELSFSEEIEEGGGTLQMEGRLAQIVFTATQFPEVRKVRFLIEGRPIKYFSGEGITEVEKPMDRENFVEFKPNG